MCSLYESGAVVLGFDISVEGRLGGSKRIHQVTIVLQSHVIVHPMAGRLIGFVGHFHPGKKLKVFEYVLQAGLKKTDKGRPRGRSNQPTYWKTVIRFLLRHGHEELLFKVQDLVGR